MRYQLMKKNHPIAMITLSKNGAITIKEILDSELLPLHLQKEDLSSAEIRSWLEKRCISRNRKNTGKLMGLAETDSILGLSFKNLGLCLTDAYWVKPEDSCHTWEEVNFFRNGYSETIGNYMYKNGVAQFELSPDINTNGMMEKAWRRRGNEDYLFKMGKGPLYQEPVNEVICSHIAASFPALKAVTYYLSDIEGQPCSVCKNFLNQTKEFVPAAQLSGKNIKDSGSVYHRLLYTCKSLGIHNASDFIDSMIAFDYLICNTDRHLCNFGFLRNTDTGNFIGPAPLFDNGNSLWADEPENLIGKGEEFSKPFAFYHEEQMMLVRNYDGILFDGLKGYGDYIYDALQANFGSGRAAAISKAYLKRVESLYQYREHAVVKKRNHYIKVNLER